MDPLNIHHVIRHRLSRIETNNFQDKSGCSINGFRSFLFEEGIVRDLDGMETIINKDYNIQDYRGYPNKFVIRDFNNFPLSDEILRMKNVRFYFLDQSKPIHKLVSPEPHFVEEERSLIENHFNYLQSNFNSDDIEDWRCFQMDCEGHLVSIHQKFHESFQLTNESIEHLSNFPCLRNVDLVVSYEENVTNFNLFSNMRDISLSFRREFEYPELLKDLGLLSNLISLELRFKIQNGLNNLTSGFFNFIFCRKCYYPSKFFQFIQFGFSSSDKSHFSRFSF